MLFDGAVKKWPHSLFRTSAVTDRDTLNCDDGGQCNCSHLPPPPQPPSPKSQIEAVVATVRDSNLKLTLAFGIGLHHAGLHERDRKTVEELFVNCKIQVGEQTHGRTHTRTHGEHADFIG